MRITKSQLDAWKAKGASIVDRAAPYCEALNMAAIGLQGQIAKLPKPRMNKTESQYAMLLEVKKRGGAIHDYAFEGLKLKLADHTFYTPDFMVIRAVTMVNGATNWITELHEVKGGFIREDAILKFKIARKMFPWFRFQMMQYKDKEWLEIYAS